MTVRTTAPSITEQREFWDHHWQHAGERQVINRWAIERFQTILDFLRSLRLKDPAILDFGCGAGYFTAQLSRWGRVTGIDLSAEAIAIARDRAPDVTFLAGNIYTTPLPSGHFDLVVSQEVLAHVEDQSRYLARAADVLKPRGYLILSTDNRFVMERLGDVGWRPLPPEHIDNYVDWRGLKGLLRRDFEVVRTTTRLPMGQRGILRLVNSAKLNGAVERMVSRAWLTRAKEWAGCGLTRIVLARKRSR